MSDKHPDYDEINRLEHELFPEWFAQDSADVVPGKPAISPDQRQEAGGTQEPPGRSAEYHGQSTEARKNPDWKPGSMRFMLLEHKRENYINGSASYYPISSVSLHPGQTWPVDSHNNIRLRKAGE